MLRQRGEVIMAVYERELSVSFKEVYDRLKEQLTNSRHLMQLHEESSYTAKQMQVAVLIFEEKLHRSNKTTVTVTIAGDDNKTWVSVIGSKFPNSIMVKTGFELEENGMQIVTDLLRKF